MIILIRFSSFSFSPPFLSRYTLSLTCVLCWKLPMTVTTTRLLAAVAHCWTELLLRRPFERNSLLCRRVHSHPFAGWLTDSTTPGDRRWWSSVGRSSVERLAWAEQLSSECVWRRAASGERYKQPSETAERFKRAEKDDARAVGKLNNNYKLRSELATRTTTRIWRRKKGNPQRKLLVDIERCISCCCCCWWCSDGSKVRPGEWLLAKVVVVVVIVEFNSKQTKC